jgi:MFS family permease
MTNMTAAGEGTSQFDEDQAKARSPYRWYVLAVLTTVYAFSVVDRNYLSLLQEPIKKDLSLSDAQLGALTGLAFAAFYATLAIPVARFSERNSRKIVVGLAIGLWSTMTFLCGLAVSFPMLLLARMGVGVGEAGGYPPSASIISDYFAADRRATALALFGLGPPVGGLGVCSVSFSAGG